MLTFKSLSLNDVVYFKQSKIDLDQRGITAIIGENRNADLEGRRNGAGKSLLVSALAHLKYGDVHNSSRSTRHSLLDQPTSSISWSIDIEDQQWLITKKRQNKVIRWSLFKNNEDQEPRTAQIAEDIINKIIPWTEEEFYTSVYLDSRRPNFLQMGTPAARHSYFTELFRLDSFEGVKKYFLNIERELDTLQIKLDTYLEQNNDLQWVEFFDKGQCLSEIEKLSNKLEDKKIKLEEHCASQRDKSNYIKYKDKLLSADKYDADRYSYLKEQEKQWTLYNDHLPEKKEYKIQMDRYNKDRATALELGITTEKELNLRIKQLIKEQNNYENLISIYKKNSKRYQVLVKKKANYDKYNKQARKIAQVSVDVIDHKLSQLDKDIEQLKIHKKGHCDKCGSTLDIERGSKKLKWLRSKRETLLNDLDTARERDTLIKLAGSWTDQEQEELVSLKNNPRPEEPDTYILDKLEDLDLTSPKKPKKVAKPSIELDKLLVELSQQKTFKEHNLIVQELRFSIERGRKVGNIDQIINKTTRGIKRLEDKLFTLKQDMRDYEKDNLSYTRLLKKIDRLHSKLEDKPLVEALIKAYSPKGLKIFVMQNLAEKIVQNLNAFSHLLFPEPFTFDITIEQNVFSIWAKRGDKISDIKYLSGAESRAFSLLWMISILPLIPNDRRCNLIILDEVTSGLDEPTQDLLINKFLPELNHIVPHVIFITPSHADYPVVDRTIKVIKERNCSTLEHT